jgi:hypothetical protein
MNAHTTTTAPVASTREMLATARYLVTTRRGRFIARRLLSGGPRHLISSIRDPYLLG